MTVLCHLYSYLQLFSYVPVEVTKMNYSFSLKNLEYYRGGTAVVTTQNRIA